MKRAYRSLMAPRRDADVIAAIQALRRSDATETPACAICGTQRYTTHLVKNGFNVVRCRNDQLLFVSPRPVDVTPYYGSEYYTGGVRGVYQSYDEHADVMAPEWTSRLERIENMSGARGRLFDVGAANGGFLRIARARGWQTRGIELSDWAAAQARNLHGLDVIAGSLPHESVGPASQDVVTMWDCIEHLSDPRGALEAIHTILKPDGLLALSTGAVPHGDPDGESGWYYPPWHLYYFAMETIKALLERTGFEMIDYSEQDAGSPYAIMSVLARPISRLPH